MVSYIVNVRLALLVAVTVFSGIVLGTAAHILSVTQTFLATYFIFDAFAIAVAVLTLVTVPLLLIFSLISKGTFPNYVVVELSWLTILWILWLSSAAFSANSLSILPSGCSFNIPFSSLTNRQTINCGEFWALEAFSWLIWLILMPYTILLLVLAIIQHNRGNYVWTQCVHEVDFSAPRVGGVMQPGMVPQPQIHSPQPMQQLLPQQVPVQYFAGTLTPSFATSSAQQRTQTPANTGYAQTTGYALVPQQQIHSPQPMVQHPLPHQVPVLYSAGPSARHVTPTSPAEQQTPMNTGYAQGPQQRIYSPQPTVQESLAQQVPVQYSAGTPSARYATPAPSYMTSPAERQTRMNTGYAQPPANTAYAQARVHTGYAQNPTYAQV